jgi:hypothetical protein
MDPRMATKTLADVYLTQGNTRKALEIYREVLKRDPSNPEILEAIQRLSGLVSQNSRSVPSTHAFEVARVEKIRNLKRWQQNIEMIRRQRRDRETS